MRKTCWQVYPLRFSLGATAAVALSLAGNVGTAQVIFDGKTGPAGALTGPNYTISDSMGLTRGHNLFHSFQQFDLGSGDTATFTGPATIQNILCRVTGPNASSINGTIKSDISGANFFFINPNGIIFGPNAAINVTGSFAASTANYLKLADGARFVAALDADDSGLSSAPVSAFGFLSGNSGSISVNQSTLAVPNGQTLSLIGGDITIDGGKVQAPQGGINLASVRSPGELSVDPGSLTTAQFQSAFSQSGQITLQNQAAVDASGDGGGRIVIRGGQLVVDNSVVQADSTGAGDGQGIDIALGGDLSLVNGGQISSASTAGLGAGGNIDITAGSIHMNGGGLVDDNFNPLTGITATTGDILAGGGSGKGGDINIHTGDLELVNSAQISTASYDGGNAGNINITASSILIDAQLATVTQISANSQQISGAGNAGSISINTGALTMQNGATILAATFGDGTAGSVDVTAHSIDIFSGSVITAATFGSGNGGDIHVTADTMHLNGAVPAFGADFPTGIQAITTSGDPAGAGGNILVNVGSLTMEHAGSIFTDSSGSGVGGNVTVHAGQLSLDTGSSISASGEADGPAGTITVTSGKDISLTRNSAINTSALQSSGGDISVTAGGNIIVKNSQISAQAGPGGGGNIVLSAPGKIYLRNGTITAQAEGDGGNLSVLNPQFFIMNKGGLISKSSTANGGNITILSDFFFQSGSTIDASAPFGLPGTVSVSAPEVDLSGSLIELPGNLVDAESLLRPDCAVRLSDDVSTFLLLGRGGLPMEPGGFVPSSTVPTRQ